MTVSGGFRLSHQQRRLWQLQSTVGERPFRARALARIDGRLDLGLLREAVGKVAGRFEILRTTFPCPAGLTLPVQQVADEAAVAWYETRDLSSLAAAEREAALGGLLSTLEDEPFDFARGPLLRLAPAVLSRDEHALALLLPALCADTVTLRNLVHQISTTYAALCGAAPEPEDSDPLQYVDLAEWQNELLEHEETAVGREHWEAWDPAVCRALRLPFEEIRTAGDCFEPRSLAVPLEDGLAQRAAALAAELDTPLPVLLLAAWQSLLWRLLGQPEMVVGLAAACRSYEGLSESLGPLVSSVPLSCQLDGDLRFADTVTRARDAVKTAAEWEEYFRWERAAERHDLALEETVFPASFTAQDQPRPWRAGLLDWTLPHFDAVSDSFRLGLRVRVEGGLPAVDLAWDATAFSRDDAEGLARAWQALLASAVARPEARLGELALSGPDGRPHLAAAKSGAAAPDLVHELFLLQAQRIPDQAAVVCAGKSLSYAELAERTRRLASLLRRHGVGPDVLVALCLERSLAMPLAILSVLEAGGAYVPLDPGLPRERKAFLLNDARPRVILTESRFLADLPAAGLPLLCLDGSWEAEVPQAGSEPASPATDPANLV
ncbi:MAG TPA: condensation domain-containing protein, partial [Thermoanaerobaculia bacterium]|nr:condensation domain-containing protein [Thermoanaerobaculia bacterium]